MSGLVGGYLGAMITEWALGTQNFACDVLAAPLAACATGGTAAQGETTPSATASPPATPTADATQAPAPDAVTLGAAYTLHMDHLVGSLDVGDQAGFQCANFGHIIRHAGYKISFTLF